MNILIIGCGRVGSSLAMILCEQGHDVSVVDKNAHSFELLDNNFNGITTVGAPIDENVLIGAGLRSCEVVCVVTDDDNLNIMVSQLCKNIYKIEKVFTRISDPEKEHIYSGMGLNTICPTNNTIETLVGLIQDCSERYSMHIMNHYVKFFFLDLPSDMDGCTAKDIEYDRDEILYAVIHEDGNMELVSDYSFTFRLGDKLLFSKIVD